MSKQIALPNVGGLEPVNQRPEKSKKADLSASKGQLLLPEYLSQNVCLFLPLDVNRNIGFSYTLVLQLADCRSCDASASIIMYPILIINLPISIFYLSIYLSIYLSTYLSIYHLPINHLSSSTSWWSVSLENTANIACNKKAYKT